MTFTPGQILSAAQLNALATSANPQFTGSIQIGPNMFYTLTAAGDVWMTINAYYDGVNWQRVNIANYAFATVYLVFTSIAGEEAFGGNTGILFLRCVPAANPISSTWWSFGGWENLAIFDQFRHMVLGGYGIEVDGSGTTPFGRFVHYSNGSPPVRTGTLTNLFIDLSGTDVAGQPSWFIGRRDDGMVIERAQAGSTTLSQLWNCDNTGMVTENAATYAGAASPGTAVLAAVNFVTSVAGGSNVKLATADNPGQSQVIINASGSSITVNPPTSGSIGGAATATLANNAVRKFYAQSSLVWF